jgi:fused signal recognition particle receptor
VSSKTQGTFGRLWGGKRPDEPGPDSAASAAMEPQASAKAGWFGRLKQGLGKTSTKLSDGITGIFTKKKLEAATLDDLEDVLIEADLGIDTAENIIAALRKGRFEKGISADDVRAVLKAEVERALAPVAKPLVVESTHKPHVILMVGVNGTGKTTTIGKLAAQFRGQGKKVMLAAADTFRAAAIDQLGIWGERTGASVVSGAVGADAAGLVYDALTQARDEGADVLLVDTAGRLQNKQGLMDELGKIRRVITKEAPLSEVLLVLDATTGQNGLNQARVFGEVAGVTGIVLTKLDGTARGGIVVAVQRELGVPVKLVGLGEGPDDLAPFDPEQFVDGLLGD